MTHQAKQTAHINSINKVFQYIETHLDEDLSLQKLADIACFSPFHFHRVFKFITHETVNEYATRKRIEKAASMLLHQDLPIVDIAHQVGFGSNAAFSKTFKQFYGVSPSVFKMQHPHKLSKIRQLKSKNGQPYPDEEQYLRVINQLNNWMIMNTSIQIQKIPQMNLAYVSSLGVQNLNHAYQQLMQWATPLGLMNNQTKMVTIYHDSFKVTAPDKVRMSAGILLHGPVAASGVVGLTQIEAGTCIVSRVEITLAEFEQAWTGLFLWMNEQGYTKADRSPFEVFHSNPNEHPQGKAIVDLYIPIQ